MALISDMKNFEFEVLFKKKGEWLRFFLFWVKAILDLSQQNVPDYHDYGHNHNFQGSKK